MAHTSLAWQDASDARELGAQVREYAREVLTPEAEAWGERHEVCPAVVQAMGASELFALATTDRYEGSWARTNTWTAHSVVREALAIENSAVEEVYTIQSLGLHPIGLLGSPEQHERWLGPLLAGQKLAAFALTEPDAGSDLGRLSTTATRDGDGWRLSGVKTFISHAPDADVYVVFARHPVADGQKRRTSAFVVEKGMEGLQLEPSMELLAPHALGTVRLEDCHVGADALLGEEGTGLRLALKSLEYFRPSVGARAVGLARRGLSLATEWSRERETFGANMIDHDVVAFKLAEMAIRIQAARASVYAAASRADQGHSIAFEGSIAKAYATEAAQWVAYEAQQLFGGRGVTAGHPAEELYRQVRAMTIYEGSSEVQRMIIAGRIRSESTDALWPF